MRAQVPGAGPQEVKIAFMGTSEFGEPLLRRLVEEGWRVVGVFTQPDRPSGRGMRETPPPIKLAALKLGLRVFQPADLKDPEGRKALKELEPDLIIVAAYGQILPEEVLELPRFGCLVVHPSLLPRHRGPSPIPFAILSGDEITGVSIILAERKPDAGPILSQCEVPIEPEDTTLSLTQKLASEAADLLSQTLPRWIRGEISPRPQEEEKATKTKKLTKKMGEIDWSSSAQEIWRKVRAFHPWPGCFTRWKGRSLKILKAYPVPGGEGKEAGLVVPLEGEGAGVVTGEGILKLCRVQLEGRRELEIAEFLRGQRDFVGSKLPC